MKQFGKISALLVCLVIAASMFIACNSVKTTAYYGDGWYRPDYGAQMEARDDELGREHIEIPEGVDTIEIDGEEYNVMRESRDYDDDKNNILANDIELRQYAIGQYEIYGHKFNGNNYKVSSIEGDSLFHDVRNATIENVIFSASLAVQKEWFHALMMSATNSVIRNCVNYFSTASLEYDGRSFIRTATNCTLENIINYGDMS